MHSFASRYSFEDTDMPSGGASRVERTAHTAPRGNRGAPRKRVAPHDKMIASAPHAVCSHDCACHHARVIR